MESNWKKGESRMQKFWSKTKLKIIIILFSFGVGVGAVFSQELPEDSDLSLSDILELKVVSTSKKSESLFETPLSSFVLTREEMKNAGVTSIQEAFRLVPGFIVRQITHGNFDVTPRGMVGVPSGNLWPVMTNSTTLVMIDNRVVYNYFQGGTFWETLPIGLEDVQQIEIIRGPAAALYGPNAISGTINIITRKPHQQGLSTWGRIAGGTPSSGRGNASASYKKDRDWNLTANVNYDKRKRFETEYYDHVRQGYVTSPSDLAHHQDTTSGSYIGGGFANPNDRFPDPDLGMRQFGTNLFFEWNPTEDIKVELQGGYQESRSVTVYNENTITPLSTRDSETTYGDLKFKKGGWGAHVAVLTGKQTMVGQNIFSLTSGTPSGCTAISTGVYACTPASTLPSFLNTNQVVANFEVDMTNWDGELEYDFRFGDFRLRPGLFARHARYESPWVGGLRELTNYAAGVQFESKVDQWRFVGAVRGEKYNYPDRPYYSWELASTRQIGDNHLLRAVYSRANKSTAMGEAFINLNFNSSKYLGTGSTGAAIVCSNNAACISSLAAVVAQGRAFYKTLSTPFGGDSELKLSYGDLFELGHRMKVTSKLVFDNEAFLSIVNNIPGVDNVGTASTPAYQVRPMEKGRQVGVTTSASYGHSSDWQGRLYLTAQTTHRYDINGNSVGKNRQTPSVFGGMVVNYRPLPKLNINGNPYFLTKQEYQSFGNINQSPAGGATNPPFQVPAKFLFNASASYEFTKETHVFLTGRNILGSKAKEYGFADQIGSTYMIGVSADL